MIFRPVPIFLIFSAILLYAGWHWKSANPEVPPIQHSTTAVDGRSSPPFPGYPIKSDTGQHIDTTAGPTISLLDAVRAIEKRSGHTSHEPDPPKVTILDSVKSAQSVSKNPTNKQQDNFDNPPPLLESIQKAQIEALKKTDNASPPTLISPFSGAPDLTITH